jgi:vitamin B12 transporter
MKKKFFIVAAVFFSSQLQAQEDTTGKLLDEVLLTSNKYPKKQSETGKVVTVINRQQLEKNAGKTLGEILNTVAGTTIIGANNNLGTNQTVSIRGASAGNVLILVDGIPVNDPSVNNNYFDINFFTVDQIERIEIVKGGQSVLYGSDAVLGVINIITRKAGAGKFNSNAGISAGSYATFKQNIGLNGRNKTINYLLGYTHLNSNGFSAAYDKNNTGGFDKDGIDQHVINGRLGIQLSNRLEAIVFSSYSHYKTDLDASAFTDEKDYTVKNDNVQGGAGLVFSHSKGSLHFNYDFNYVEREYLDDSAFRGSPYVNYSKGRYIGRTHYAELYNNWKWTNWELLAGADYRLNNTDQFYFSTGVFGPYAPPAWKAKMSQVSPYASVVYKDKNGFTTEFGGRWNHHSEYGSNFTFNINPFYLLNNKVKLFANLYSSFKTPTLYQLFDPSAGNTELDPEKGIIGEAGTEIFTRQSFRFRLVGFYRRTKDAIVYTFNPSGFTTRYLNVSKQDNYGAELEANYTINKWNIAANYTYTDGKTKSRFDGTGTPIGKDTTYYNLYRIPKNAFNLTIGWQATIPLFISSMLRAVSKREEFIFGASPQTLKAYATIDLYGEYKFSRKIKVFLDLKNITNKTYFDIPGYNSRKFNFMAGINFNL